MMFKTLFSCFIILLSAALILLPEAEITLFASEILIQFRVQILMLLVLLLAALLIKKQFIAALIQCAIIVFGAFPVADAYGLLGSNVASCQLSAPDRNFRFMTHNVYYRNDQHDRILYNIENISPDILILQEAQDSFVETKHDELSVEYPFSYPNKNRLSPIMLYSRYPIEHGEFTKLPETYQYVLNAKLNMNGTPLHLIGIHAQSPKSEQRILSRNKTIRALATILEEINQKGEAMIAAGDFNTVQWHPVMRDMMARAGLIQNKESLDAYGTWSSKLPKFFTVPIDHIFMNSKLVNSNYKKGNAAGSDHFSVYADLYLCE